MKKSSILNKNKLRGSLFMKISVIVCEYNLFHNGHKRQIEQVRKSGTTHIISIMSGNFTQRGTSSVISKHKKAEIALKNGCDLIVELPTPYSVANAEKFALGAVFIANSLNCVDFLSFGCENNDLDSLKKAAEVSNSSEVMKITKEFLEQGSSFVSARCKAVKMLFGNDLANLISTPNNILAVEYIKSLIRLNSQITPMPILRKGCQHNSNSAVGNFASSTLLREMLFKNDKNIKNFMPKSSYEILNKEVEKGFAPAQILNCERAFLAKLRCMKPADFLQIADVTEGLENKIYKAVQNSISIEEVYAQIKSKRYTQVRIQRILLSAFLGINKEIFNFLPPYIKILGFNDKGKEILKIAKNKSRLPIVTKISDIKKLKNDNAAMAFFEIESRAFDLYNLMLPRIQRCGFESTNQIVKI